MSDKTINARYRITLFIRAFINSANGEYTDQSVHQETPGRGLYCLSAVLHKGTLTERRSNPL